MITVGAAAVAGLSEHTGLTDLTSEGDAPSEARQSGGGHDIFAALLDASGDPATSPVASGTKGASAKGAKGASGKTGDSGDPAAGSADTTALPDSLTVAAVLLPTGAGAGASVDGSADATTLGVLGAVDREGVVPDRLAGVADKVTGPDTGSHKSRGTSLLPSGPATGPAAPTRATEPGASGALAGASTSGAPTVLADHSGTSNAPSTDAIGAVGAPEEPVRSPGPKTILPLEDRAGGEAAVEHHDPGAAALHDVVTPSAATSRPEPSTPAAPVATPTESANAVAPLAHVRSSATSLPGVASQLVAVIAPVRPVPAGGHTVTIALQPEGLGAVRASVTATNDLLLVRLTASSNEGDAAVRASLPELHSALSGPHQEATVTLTGDSGTPWGGSNAPHPDLGSDHHFDRSVASVATVERPSPATTARVAVPTPSTSSSGLDVRM